MSNLNVENLSKIIQTGNIEDLYSGGIRPRASEQSEGGVAAGSTSGGEKNFSEILKESVSQTNLYQTQADTAVKELVAGRNKNIHETMLTLERADTSLKLMMQVRNKILDAYKEIIRMQV
jgi:flagellar hook-basal body complex protein FliE